MRNFTCFCGLTNSMSLSTENVSRMTREILVNGSVKSRKLFTTIFILFLIGVGNVWGDTNIPTNGLQYRIKANYSSTDYYLVAPTSSGLGDNTTTEANGTVFTFTYESSKWYVTFVNSGTTYYMYGHSDNGKVGISTSKTECTTVTTNGDYCKIGGDKWIQFNYNNGSPRFGCYSSVQTGAVLVPIATYDIDWYVGGERTKQETSVAVGTPPSVADNALGGSCSSLKFLGWSETEIGSAPDDAPADLFPSYNVPVPTSDKVYYAVFGDAVYDTESTPTKIQTLQYDSWTYSGSTTDKQSYRLFHSGSYIQSAPFDLSGLAKVIVYGGTFGGSSYNSLTIGDGTNTWKDVTVTGNSETGTNEYTGGTALSGTGSLRIISKSGTASNTGVRISKVEIYMWPVEYSNCVTTCCTPYNINLAGSGTVTGGTIEVDPTSACKDETVTLTATPSTGYTFTEWTVYKDEDDSDVTSDVIADGGEDESYVEMTMPEYDVTIDATFTAKKYAIVLDKNGGTSDGAATATYNSSSLSSVTDASYTGYTLLGYYTETSGGDMVITANGALVASVGDYTDKDSKWIYDDGATFSAHWKPTGTWGVTITTPSNGTITVTYNSGASSMTSGSAYIGGSVTITATGNTGYELATDGLKVNGTTFTSGNSLTLSEDITISATFTLKKYNIAVTPNSNVAITATPLGESAIGEGTNSDVSYGTTMTLAYSDVESGYYWSGWKLTNAGGDDVTTTLLGSGHESDNSATFTVPDYNVTVMAKLYGNLKAWCIPTFTVTGDVHLTSTAGVYVNQTENAGNLINFSGSDLYNVSKITIDYLNENGDVVDNASSPLRLYGSAGTSLAEVNITSFTEGAYNQDYSIRFTVPGNVYNKEYNYKLRLQLHKLVNGGGKYRVIKTVEHPMNGRALPEEFVIAVKKDNQWYALPNNLESTSSQPSIVPKKITVDDDDTPTTAYYAATTTVYKATGRNAATKYMNGIRFTTTGTNYLQTAKAGNTYNMWLSTTNSDSAQVWYLSSTDFGAYTLKMDTKHNGTKKMGIYAGGYMGFHVSPSASDIYFLPITNKYTEIAATASEWGEHGVIVKPTTPSDLSSVTSATMNIGIAEPTAATATAVNAAIGTANRVKVDGGVLTVGALANEGKQLYVHWKNGGTEIGVSQLTIPRIVAADRTANKTNDGNKNVWNTEVHVLPGATLTIDGSTFVTGTTNSTVSMNELHVYPGATINISTGKLSASTLRLRNGWTRAGTKKYDVARVYINASNDAALEKTTASMDYDIYEQSDGKHYYPLAVPFETAVSGIDYADTYLAGFSTYGTHYVIKEYDGANRAANGEDSNNNWDVVSDASNLVPGRGYIMTAVAVKGEAIIRVPLVFDNAWTADGEKASYVDGSSVTHTKNTVAVTAHAGAAATANKRHAGWNMLGVPYMSCYQTGTGMYGGVGDAVLINGKIIVTPGNEDPYSYGGSDVPYVTVPTHDFSEYIQMEISDTKAELLPGWSFFIQVGTTGNLTFAVDNQRPDEDNPIYAPQRTMDSTMTRIKTGVILSSADGETSDKFGLIISDRYTQDYEVGADLEKMFGNGYTLATYSLSQGTRLAFNALSTADAAQVIPVGYRAPEAGQYTFAINPRYATEGLLRVELIDYQTGDLTDLLTNTYTFTTSRTQDDTRFAIHVTYTDPNSEMPTGEAPPIETGETLTRKFILNGQLYIQRGTVIYDATGKEVRL